MSHNSRKGGKKGNKGKNSKQNTPKQQQQQQQNGPEASVVQPTVDGTSAPAPTKAQAQQKKAPKNQQQQKQQQQSAAPNAPNKTAPTRPPTAPKAPQPPLEPESATDPDKCLACQEVFPTTKTDEEYSKHLGHHSDYVVGKDLKGEPASFTCDEHLLGFSKKKDFEEHVAKRDFDKTVPTESKISLTSPNQVDHTVDSKGDKV